MPEGTIKEVKLAPIRNGTVIDHITCGQALNVMKILGVNESNIDSSISIGMHVISAKTTEWKDIIKIEDRELDSKTVDKGPRRGPREVQQPQLHHQPRRARQPRVQRHQQAPPAAEVLLLRQDTDEHLRQPAVI